MRRSVWLRHHRVPIFTIQNHSRDWVTVKLSFEVSPDEDLEKTRKLVKKVGVQLLDDLELEGPFLAPLKSHRAVAWVGATTRSASSFPPSPASSSRFGARHGMRSRRPSRRTTSAVSRGLLAAACQRPKCLHRLNEGPIMSHPPRIAIIGAGITGLRLAQRLAAQARIDVFEKSRGFGGRMSTRRADYFQFDHGAQYFTAHTAAFRDFLTPFLADGTAARWSPKLVDLTAGQVSDRAWTAPRYVAVPGMNALCKALAVDQTVWRSTPIAAIERVEAAWSLVAADGERYGPYDWVLSTAPAEQSAQLMPEAFAESDVLNAAQMQGCYSLMLGFADTLDTGWEAAVVHDSPLAWIALNHSKPGRPQATSILCQSSNDWAEAYLEDDMQAVTASLSDAFAAATKLNVSAAQYVSLHKWRFAKVACPAEKPCLVDLQEGLGAAGDWCGAGRVETGFNSADALADAIIESI